MPPKKCVLPLVQLSLKTIPGMVRKHATLTADHLVELWWKQKQDSEKKSNFKYQNREKVKFRLKAKGNSIESLDFSDFWKSQGGRRSINHRRR